MVNLSNHPSPSGRGAGGEGGRVSAGQTEHKPGAFWIPAFAGMTVWGATGQTQFPWQKGRTIPATINPVVLYRTYKPGKQKLLFVNYS